MSTPAPYRSLNGVECGKTVRARIADAAAHVLATRGRAPHLAAVLVGEDPASQTYVGSKVKACGEVGFRSSLLKRTADISEAELLALVEHLNNDAEVDGFHPQNLGRMMLGLPGYLPATPNGIVELLKHYEVPTEGKHCVVVGRSNIVGTPMSILMSRNTYPGNCTVTIAHSRTKDLPGITRQADILIVAIGKPDFITADMVKAGAVVVDVGIHRVDDATRKKGYRICGDVDFEAVAPKCSWITPVPGGVGPMTVTSLLLNTLKAAGG